MSIVTDAFLTPFAAKVEKLLPSEAKLVADLEKFEKQATFAWSNGHVAVVIVVFSVIGFMLGHVL